MKLLNLSIATAAMLAAIPFAGADAKDLAKVNGVAITQKEVDQLKESLPKEMSEKGVDDAKILEQLIDIEALKQAALKADLGKKKEVQEAIEKAKEQVLIQAFMMDQLSSVVNEAAVKKKYEELSEKFPKNKKETRVRHILVADEKTAKSLVDKLKAGEDFQKLARENSKDTESAKNNGDLGYFVEGSFVPEFEKAAADLAPGKYTTDPVKTQFGFHIIKVEDRRTARPPKFEDVKPQLAQLVQQEAMVKLIKRLRDKASVEMLGEPAAASKKADEKKADDKDAKKS